MSYQCVATSLEGFVQQVAVCYIRHGYWWYVSGVIPEQKDPERIDQKMIAKYGIDVSATTRWRRKRAGQANLQYIRFRRRFVIMATQGAHRFKEVERAQLRDVRSVPIRIGGYSISCRRGGRTRTGERDSRLHSHVQIDWPVYKELKAEFLAIACRRTARQLTQELWLFPFEPYAPVRRQLLTIYKTINQMRRRRRQLLIPKEALPLRRRIVKPFEPVDGAISEQPSRIYQVEAAHAS